MKKFKQFFDEYKALHTPQRDVDEDPTSKQSAQAKQLILRNNLKYNKETGCYDAQGNVRVKNEDLINGALPLQLGEVAGSMVFELCNDLFGKYLIFGFAFLLIFQTLLNLCVVVGLVPITGVTLPFISYGGSSLLVSMISIGIILNVSNNRK